MSERTRFGPAGVPPMFRLMGATTIDVPKLLHEEGLDAFEYQASRWGAKPQIKQIDAQRLGEEARRNDVKLSMHGSYFINLSGKPEVVEASKQRLLACATAADWMGAYVVVFHMGFYGKFEKSYAFKQCMDGLKEVNAEIKQLGLKVKLGPETMGRKSQVGTIDEILAFNREVEGTQLVIDWGHLHALHQGAFRKMEDMRAIAEKVERELGTEAKRRFGSRVGYFGPLRKRIFGRMGGGNGIFGGRAVGLGSETLPGGLTSSCRTFSASQS